MKNDEETKPLAADVYGENDEEQVVLTPDLLSPESSTCRPDVTPLLASTGVFEIAVETFDECVVLSRCVLLLQVLQIGRQTVRLVVSGHVTPAVHLGLLRVYGSTYDQVFHFLHHSLEFVENRTVHVGSHQQNNQVNRQPPAFLCSNQGEFRQANFLQRICSKEGRLQVCGVFSLLGVAFPPPLVLFYASPGYLERAAPFVVFFL